MPEPISATVVDLQQVKEERILTPLDPRQPKLWRTYTEPAPYLVQPCQVIAFPAKGSTSSDK